MKNVKDLLLNGAAIAVAAFVMSGCSALQETLASQMEVPTLEIQSNRVAVGMTIVRENNIMAFKIPISADAKWPAMVSADINDTKKKVLDRLLQDSPYFSTVDYTKKIQRDMLGSGMLANMAGGAGAMAASALDQTVSPLTYRAVNKLNIFYGDDKKNWPDPFSFDGSLKNFLDFKDVKIVKIDSPKGDIYQTIGDAVISLAPVGLQKTLASSNSELLDAYGAVASMKSQKGELETKLKDVAQSENKTKNQSYGPLTAVQKADIQKEIEVIDQKIKEAESFADEKEKIYFNLLDKAIIALESDIDLSDENYVKLARNVNMVSNEIKESAKEAYTAFGLAVTNIAANNIILKFPKELESLSRAKSNVPPHLQEKYAERVSRLVKNAIYLLPNIFIGTYYANKQSTLAEKYEKFTGMIVLAHDKKNEQEKAAAKDVKVNPDADAEAKDKVEKEPAAQPAAQLETKPKKDAKAKKRKNG